MSEEKVIRGIDQGKSNPALMQKYDSGTDKAVAVSEESGLPVRTNPAFPLDVSRIDDFYLEVSKGNIPGHKMYSIPGRKDGLSQTLLDDLTQIPGNTVTPVPGGLQLELVSTDDEDSGAGGIVAEGDGIRSVDIHYLNPAGIEQEETVVLDGTTVVTTVADDIENIQWMHAKTVGDTGVAEGNISLRNLADTPIYEYILAGGNQSLSARYTIPSDKTGFLLGWQVSAVAFAIDFRLRATVERFDRSLIPEVFLFQDALVLDVGASGWIPFEVPKRLPPNSQIKISGLSTAAGGNGGGQFDVLLIDNSEL